MEITLRIEGKDKTFTNDFVAARIFRDTLELNKKFSAGIDLTDPGTFDLIVDFVVSAFDSNFTVDDVWNGLPASKLQSEIMRIYNEVLSLGGLELKAVTEGEAE